MLLELLAQLDPAARRASKVFKVRRAFPVKPGLLELRDQPVLPVPAARKDHKEFKGPWVLPDQLG